MAEHRWICGLAAAMALGVSGVAAQEVVDQGCFDIRRGAPGCTTIQLVTSTTEPGTVDLQILGAASAGLAPLDVPGIAFYDENSGAPPAIVEVPGGIRLQSERSALGRFPWFESLEIVLEGDGLVVVGFGLSSYDRVAPRTFSCAVDYAVGRVRIEVRDETLTGSAAERTQIARDSVAVGAVPLTEWMASRPWPEPCADAQAAFTEVP
ncbi:MAG: hypothetical protein AAF914_14240 [Pseudomonadota bacterium]